MSLLTGARIGAYEVIGPLGAGGMGEVFRARDSRFEVYVRSFPKGDEVIQVSTAGGTSPLWAPSGRELLCRRGDGMIMSTTVDQAPAPLINATRSLFDATGYDFQFAFAPDGQRLLMMPLIESETAITEVHLVLNFLDELRRRFR